MPSSRVPSYTSGRQKRTAHAFSEIFGIKVSKDNTHPVRFYRSLEYPCTLRNAKNARLHAFSEIFKQRFLKIIRTPHAFIVLSSTLVHFGTLKTHGCTHSQKYLVLRFLKIIHTPHVFIVLSSTLVHFGTLKTHGCTHSQKYLAKVSKDNAHPARFYRSLEYPCKMCSRRQRKLR